MVLSAIPATGQPIPYGPDVSVSAGVPIDTGPGTGIHTGSIGPAGLTIVPTFDPSITSLPGDAARVEAAINAAISAVEAKITSPNNITVPIYFTNMSSGLGGSETGDYSAIIIITTRFKRWPRRPTS